MYRTPCGRAQRSPGGPRPAGRFPSPDPSWGSPFPGPPRGFSPEFSPRFPSGSNQGYYRQDQDGSPGGYGGWSRGFSGQMRRRGHGFRRPQNFSPSFSPNPQSRRSDAGVEKFFRPSMLEDPWRNLQPVTAEDAAARRTAWA